MARREDRRKVIQLRKQGKTYTEIRQITGISKATLSNWLSQYPLTSSELSLLKKNIEQRKFVAIEKIRDTKAKNRKQRLEKIYKKELKKLPLNENELYLSGLFLYLGEGVKGFKTRLGLNNTDPKIMKFYLYWMINILHIPKTKIRAYVHLYEDMDVDKSLKYWSQELNIPLSQFNKPYIKNSKRSDIDHKGHGHGTCGLYYNNVRLKEKIVQSFNSITDYYSEKI